MRCLWYQPVPCSSPPQRDSKFLVALTNYCSRVWLMKLLGKTLMAEGALRDDRAVAGRSNIRMRDRNLYEFENEGDTRPRSTKSLDRRNHTPQRHGQRTSSMFMALPP
jgi:hypothetical protein